MSCLPKLMGMLGHMKRDPTDRCISEHIRAASMPTTSAWAKRNRLPTVAVRG